MKRPITVHLHSVCMYTYRIFVAWQQRHIYLDTVISLLIVSSAIWLSVSEYGKYFWLYGLGATGTSTNDSHVRPTTSGQEQNVKKKNVEPKFSLCLTLVTLGCFSICITCHRVQSKQCIYVCLAWASATDTFPVCLAIDPILERRRNNWFDTNLLLIHADLGIACAFVSSPHVQPFRSCRTTNALSQSLLRCVAQTAWYAAVFVWD